MNNKPQLQICRAENTVADEKEFCFKNRDDNIDTITSLFVHNYLYQTNIFSKVLTFMSIEMFLLAM